jgi:hypothetical protein
MEVKSVHSSGGIGIPGMVFVVFLTLKLIGIIQWSWLWVLAPIWMPVTVLVLMAVILFVIG